VLPGNTGFRLQGNTVAGCQLPVAGKYRFKFQVSGFREIQVSGYRLKGNTGFTDKSMFAFSRFTIVVSRLLSA
jgi:hypothetical protein